MSSNSRTSKFTHGSVVIPAPIAHNLRVLLFALVLAEMPVQVLFILDRLLRSETRRTRRALDACVHGFDDAAVLAVNT